MAFSKILVALFVGSVAGQSSRTFAPLNFPNRVGSPAPSSFPASSFPVSSSTSFQPSTTPVPILRFIDQQNTDGGYTYGFESADGTYKIETRLPTGEVKGKYGYYDTNGVLRETTYGAQSGQGFIPVIDGVEVAPPTAAPVPSPAPAPAPLPPPTGAPAPAPELFNQINRNVRTKDTEEEEEDIVKIVNGRRAVLKKRLRAKDSPAAASVPVASRRSGSDSGAFRNSRINPIITNERQLRNRARQQKQQQQQQQQQQQLQLQQQQKRIPAVRVPQIPTVERERSSPSQFSPLSGVSEPYVNGINLNTGSYSINYSG